MDVKYFDYKIKENRIIDPFLTKIGSQLQLYVEKCNELRNDYLKKDEAIQKISASDYVRQSNSYSYLNFSMKTKDLEDLRKGYLHWSASLAAPAMEPNVSGVHPLSARKRKVIHG